MVSEWNDQVSAILVSYDLNTPGQKYEKLYEKIKAYGTYAKILDSAWIVCRTGITPESVYTDLKKVLDDGDHIFAVDISSSARQGWLPQATWDWIKANV